MKYILILLILFITLPSAYAEEQLSSGTFSLTVENDLYHSDRYYTNGVRAAWLSDKGEIPEWAMRAAMVFPFFPYGSTVHVGYAVGQNMYTPRDIEEENPPRKDRPYAGWFYGSAAVIAETGQRLDQLELTIGVIGPESMAEEAQKNVHRTIASPRPEAWDTQLKNELGVILMYQRSWRSYVTQSMLGVPIDITPNIGGAVGNVFTYANAGAMIRYGFRLPNDYGPPRIQPSLPGTGFFKASERLSWYIFAGAEARAVARNIFLDGNTFADSRSVEKKNLVGDFQFGFVLSKGKYQLSYTNVVRTKEFREQEHDTQSFGAVSLSFSY